MKRFFDKLRRLNQITLTTRWYGINDVERINCMKTSFEKLSSLNQLTLTTPWYGIY